DPLLSAALAGRLPQRRAVALARRPGSGAPARPRVRGAGRREGAVRAVPRAPGGAGRPGGPCRRACAPGGGAGHPGPGGAGPGARVNPAAPAALPARAVPAWRRRLTFTRLGRWYVALTLGIGLAAMTTGNNLLFLVLGLLLSSIVVSGLLSETSLRGVRVTRRLPASASVGAPALVGLVARNGKPRAPSFGLDLREKGGEVSGRGLVLLVGAGASEEVSYRLTPGRRRAHRFAQLALATRAPSGLSPQSRPLDAPTALVV